MKQVGMLLRRWETGRIAACHLLRSFFWFQWIYLESWTQHFNGHFAVILGAGRIPGPEQPFANHAASGGNQAGKGEA
jgi:hypothetical protein